MYHHDMHPLDRGTYVSTHTPWYCRMHASKRNRIFSIPEVNTNNGVTQESLREQTVIWRRETAVRRYHHRNRKRLERNRPFIGLLGNASYEMAHGSKTQGRKVLNSRRGGADIISHLASRHTASLYIQYVLLATSIVHSICCCLLGE